MYRFEKQEV